MFVEYRVQRFGFHDKFSLCPVTTCTAQILTNGIIKALDQHGTLYYKKNISVHSPIVSDAGAQQSVRRGD